MSTQKPRIHGIGGLFFKSRDPKALASWYAEQLGMPVQEWGGAVLPWRRSDTGGPACSVWSPFAHDTKYFEPGTSNFMLNLRVDDLEAMLDALREAGCRVLDDRREDSEQGRFGYVLDPEDNLIELWQPAPDGDAAAQG